MEKRVGRSAYKNKYNYKYFGVRLSKIKNFMYYADFIDIYILLSLNMFIARNYIIISGAARGRREYNKGHDRILLFFEDVKLLVNLRII